ncbi:MAG TPA: PaaI family thioesterase [Actinomycetota bacterium]|nr:PaaI family thioesterase [Actinomycetota bacterium]
MPSEIQFEHYSEKVADAFVNMPSHTALPDFLGVEFTEAGPGVLVAEMDVRPELLTPFGNLHGGVVAVLVDHVLGSVMYPVMPRGWWAATTEYKINNLAPVREGRLRAEAQIIAMTKRTSVVRIDVTNGDRLVCVAQGTCLLQEPKPKTEAPPPPAETKTLEPSGTTELDLLEPRNT